MFNVAGGAFASLATLNITGGSGQKRKLRPKLGYWYNSDLKIVRKDDFTITQTWALTNGTAVDISAWTFKFEANEIDSSGTPGNIIVLDAAMTKSNSGSGVTDTVSIPITDTQTTIDEGRYAYDITAVVGTDTTTVARGTLTVFPSEQDS